MAISKRSLSAMINNVKRRRSRLNDIEEASNSDNEENSDDKKES